MSFDSEFDYTGSITFIDTRTDSINVERSTITTRLASLANVDSSFSYLVYPEITSLNQTKSVYDGMIVNLQNLRSNILAVTNMSNEHKVTLYEFYSNALSQTNESKKQWMSRMVYNINGLIADAGNVNAGSLTLIEKGLLAEVICGKYPVNGTVYQVQREF